MRPTLRTRQRTLSEDALIVAFGVSFAIPLAIWLASGGAATFATIGGALTGVGIIAGLVFTVMMVWMLLLAARAPFIEKVIGQDRALALHSTLGQWTVGGLLAHALFLIAGYSATEGVGLWAEIVSLFGDGDLALAYGSIGMLGLVAVTSIAAAKRFLPQEAWKGIHLLTYAAFVLSIPHQFTAGGLFTGAAFWFWAIFLSLPAYALLRWRIFGPLADTLAHRVRVVRVERIAPDAATIVMRGRDLSELNARSGQFFHWRFLAPGLWWHQHPFSLSAAPTGDELRITVRALGRGSHQIIENLKPGTPVLLEGPYGTFTEATRTHDDLVLVGIGIGIAPIRSLLEDAAFAPGHATVILRASTPEEVFLGDEIAQIAAERGARLLVLTGHRGHRADGSTSWLPERHGGYTLSDLAPLANADLYVCGPVAATDQVVAEACAAGLSDEQIHFERFSW